MTHTELQQLQKRIKFNAPAMAICLGIKYDTYRHFVSGHAKIPADIERKAVELENINNQFMVTRYQPGGEFDRELSRCYPQGIASEI